MKTRQQIKDEVLKELESLSDKYRKYAGEWHLQKCAFPDVDAAVCNCSLRANKKTVKSLFSSSLDKAMDAAVGAVKLKKVEEYTSYENLGGAAHNEGFNEAVSDQDKLIKEFNDH